MIEYWRQADNVTRFMRKCEKCGKTNFNDASYPKEIYANISIDYGGRCKHIDLCGSCYKKLEVNFLKNLTAEEFNYEFAEVINYSKR